MDAVDLATGGGAFAVVMGLIEVIKGQVAKRKNGDGGGDSPELAQLVELARTGNALLGGLKEGGWYWSA